MKEDKFPGLLGLVDTYLDTLDIDKEAKFRIERYLNLIRQRSNGRRENPPTMN